MIFISMTEKVLVDKRLLNVKEFCAYLGIGQTKARELGLYMQKYCGCIFSEEDRYKKQIKKDKENGVKN